MLLLDGANEKLQVITGSAADLRVHASYMENNSGTVTPKTVMLAAIAAAATTDVVGVPTAGKQRNIKEVTAYNAHATTSTTAKFQVVDGTSTEIVWFATILAGETLVFDETGAWTLYDTNGQVKPSSGAFATQADMEAATSLVVAVPPGRLHFHPGVAKFVCMTTGLATPAMQTPPSYNMTSITDAGVGRLTVTIANDFSSVNWCCQCLAEYSSTTLTETSVTAHPHIRNATLAAGTVEVNFHDTTATTNALRDPTSIHVVGYGDQ